jgi:hypothetical protein
MAHTAKAGIGIGVPADVTIPLAQWRRLVPTNGRMRKIKKGCFIM